MGTRKARPVILTVALLGTVHVLGTAGPAWAVQSCLLNGKLVIPSSGVVNGTAGRDVIDCSAVTFPLVINGSSDADTIIGGQASDQIYGDSGNDNLKGGCGNDDLYGLAGNDTLGQLIGDDGTDNFFGGSGTNKVVPYTQSGGCPTS
jgi:hypothetical protein